MQNKTVVKDKAPNESIAKAILRVMAAVRGMEKNSRVGSGNMAYDGTKDQDVKEAFNLALADAGLCILPIEIKESTQIDRWEAQGYQGKTVTKQSVFTKVKTKYMLLHKSGESITLAGYGHGVDPQDKGAGKATTYALKNCLLYTFLTPVGKIADTDTTHSGDIEIPEAEVKRKPIEEVPERYLRAVKMLRKKIEEEYGESAYTDILKGLGLEKAEDAKTRGKQEIVYRTLDEWISKKGSE